MRPLASVDNTVPDLLNSSYPTQPHSLIAKYSPPSEWIMCELGVFFIFLENDLLKVDKIIGLTFFKARKDLNARGRRRLTSSNVSF